MIWPIYVPSYGRAGNSQTLAALLAEGMMPKICVELGELEIYRDKYPYCQIVVNTSKPRSISGARQSILKHARENETKWYWQIDDTVKGIEVRKEPHAKALPKSWSQALAEMQMLQYCHKQVALISSDFPHLATFSDRPFSLNTRCMVITGTRTDTDCNYDVNLTMKEDIDFCLQTIAKRFITLLSHLHVQEEIAMGKNTTGGMVELYAQNGFHLKGCNDLIRKWPNIIQMDKVRHGRPEIKVKWNKIGTRKEKQK